MSFDSSSFYLCYRRASRSVLTRLICEPILAIDRSRSNIAQKIVSVCHRESRIAEVHIPTVNSTSKCVWRLYRIRSYVHFTTKRDVYVHVAKVASTMDSTRTCVCGLITKKILPTHAYVVDLVQFVVAVFTSSWRG